ncbi:MAG: RNA polymerase sigma factor RpoE [Myxococcales bacterium]
MWQICRVDGAAKPEPGSGLPLFLRGQKAGIEDAELCRRASLGDGEAFHVIFQRHGAAVHRFLASALRDGAEADEAVQETFVRAHARLKALNDPARLRPWLLGIARIVALDAHTFRRRDAAREEQRARTGVVDLDPTPEAQALDAEAERVLADEIGALAPQRRAALVLRVDHGLGYPEIAEAMGWPLQKVKNEIHRARLQIRGRVLRYLRGRP